MGEIPTLFTPNCDGLSILETYCVPFRARTLSESVKDYKTKMSERRRAPSISSSSFAIPEDFQTVHGINDTESTTSTDSYASQDEEEQLFDPVTYLTDTLENALSSLEFSKAVAKQAKISGQLKSKELELLRLYEESQSRLQELHDTMQRGLKTLHIVYKDLKLNKHKVEAASQRISNKYPIEYNQARDKVLRRDTLLLDDEDVNNNDNDNEIRI